MELRHPVSAHESLMLKYIIMRIGGWKARSVFERYNIVDQHDVREALSGLE